MAAAEATVEPPGNIYAAVAAMMVGLTAWDEFDLDNDAWTFGAMRARDSGII